MDLWLHKRSDICICNFPVQLMPPVIELAWNSWKVFSSSFECVCVRAQMSAPMQQSSDTRQSGQTAHHQVTDFILCDLIRHWLTSQRWRNLLGCSRSLWSERLPETSVCRGFFQPSPLKSCQNTTWRETNTRVLERGISSVATWIGPKKKKPTLVWAASVPLTKSVITCNKSY